MAILILLIIILFYIVSYYIAFKLPMPMTAIAIPRYETLRYRGRLLGFLSWIFLIIVLIIHAVVYWAFALGVNMFSFLLWINDHTTDEDDGYFTQVILICFFAMLPYGKYSFSLGSRFKKQLFKYLQDKYKTKFKVLDNKKFISKLSAKNISRYVLTREEFLEIIIEKHSDKKKRYKSSFQIDDALFFEDKGLSICEAYIAVSEEVYEWDEDDEKYKWKSGKEFFKCFEGLIIIIDKLKDNISKSGRYKKSKLYKINNSKVLTQSDSRRNEKKNSFFVKFYLFFFGVEYKDVLIKESLSSLRNIENLENYDTINKPLAQIAETLNVDYVMEDNKKIYLFHREEGIDFFTYYQNEKTSISTETFEEDFKLLLEISERF